MSTAVLAIDQGTTSSRAIVFDGAFGVLGVAQKEFTQLFPHSGWVEHNPEEIWDSVVETCRSALAKAGLEPKDVAALGITNQRETVVVWDRATGKAICNAIVWQDRRTAPLCRNLKAAGHEAEVTKRTGLLLDPYFSGTKLAWILDNVGEAREKAEAGKLAFGTIDSFLLWRFTGGRVHATDATNASRTLLYNIAEQRWDQDLLDLLRVPASLLPEVRDCDASFGETEPSLFGGPISISGMAGDQHAATIGQACFRPGMMKSTYGTGCFAVLNTGKDLVPSRNRMLTTIAYRIGGETAYALEGSIFNAGTVVQWLRDGLGLLEKADDSGPMAEGSDPTQAVYLVPAFTGLGAPHWDAEARGSLHGLTRNTGPKELARAGLESVCYQTRDLLEAMQKDWAGAGASETVLRVDGGMAASDWTMQFLADMLGVPVDRPRTLETTAMGAAYLAGLRAGVYPGMEDFAKTLQFERRFTPGLAEDERQAKYAGWVNAVRRTLS